MLIPLLQELLHHHKILQLTLCILRAISGPWWQADFIWLCRSTWGPRFQVCQVGLGSAVTFLNGYYKGFELGRLPSQWILGWGIREGNYLDTLIYRLCFIAHSWCKISSRLHGLRAVFLMAEISFLGNGLNDVAGLFHRDGDHLWVNQPNNYSSHVTLLKLIWQHFLISLCRWR